MQHSRVIVETVLLLIAGLVDAHLRKLHWLPRVELEEPS